MAGSHNAGFDASDENLFNNKKTIIVDAFKIDSEKLTIVEKFWQKLGSKTIKMNVDEHDYAVAYASHLPHLIAFGLTDAIKNEANSGINESSAGGLKEFLRIAASDPDNDGGDPREKITRYNSDPSWASEAVSYTHLTLPTILLV